MRVAFAPLHAKHNAIGSMFSPDGRPLEMPSRAPQTRGKMPARPALLVASAFLLCASRAAEVDSAPGAKFNKAELEAILKKEHSDRVSNIYDSENGIQRRRLPNK